ncbi:hypothetical protein A8B81_08205 [Sulfitobacter pontiacus]|nr:hypothetical protein A8B81_08205 [Sulfitobacter pontiacus]
MMAMMSKLYLVPMPLSYCGQGVAVGGYAFALCRSVGLIAHSVPHGLDTERLPRKPFGSCIRLATHNHFQDCLAVKTLQALNVTLNLTALAKLRCKSVSFKIYTFVFIGSDWRTQQNWKQNCHECLGHTVSTLIDILRLA